MEPQSALAEHLTILVGWSLFYYTGLMEFIAPHSLPVSQPHLGILGLNILCVAVQTGIEGGKYFREAVLPGFSFAMIGGLVHPDFISCLNLTPYRAVERSNEKAQRQARTLAMNRNIFQ